MDVVYRFLADGEISIHDDRWLTYPWGVLGGKTGARSTKYIVKPDGRRVVLPSKGDHIRVEKGDVLHFVTWGGGGWGNPLDREPEKVQLDVLRGLVSIESARAEYGVVLLDNGEQLDTAATDRLRSELRAAQRDVKTFDFGPPIEEIVTRAEVETGLPAPERPVFREAAKAI
jgi:N-methylhydantoinase B